MIAKAAALVAKAGLKTLKGRWMRTFKPPADYGKGRQQRILVRLKRWAEAHHVELEEIPEDPERKTPDYRVIFPDTDRTEVIIEAKEITINSKWISSRTLFLYLRQGLPMGDPHSGPLYGER